MRLFLVSLTFLIAKADDSCESDGTSLLQLQPTRISKHKEESALQETNTAEIDCQSFPGSRVWQERAIARTQCTGSSTNLACCFMQLFDVINPLEPSWGQSTFIREWNNRCPQGYNRWGELDQSDRLLQYCLGQHPTQGTVAPDMLCCEIWGRTRGYTAEQFIRENTPSSSSGVGGGYTPPVITGEHTGPDGTMDPQCRISLAINADQTRVAWYRDNCPPECRSGCPPTGNSRPRGPRRPRSGERPQRPPRRSLAQKNSVTVEEAEDVLDSDVNDQPRGGEDDQPRGGEGEENDQPQGGEDDQPRGGEEGEEDDQPQY